MRIAVGEDPVVLDLAEYFWADWTYFVETNKLKYNWSKNI